MNYTMSLLEDVGFVDVKLAPIPIQHNMKLTTESGDLLEDGSLYGRLVVRLLHLTISRPDITYAINRLSQFMYKSCVPHLQALHYLLRYLKSTPGQGLLFSSNS